jgi:hypothetical protein
MLSFCGDTGRNASYPLARRPYSFEEPSSFSSRGRSVLGVDNKSGLHPVYSNNCSNITVFFKIN